MTWKARPALTTLLLLGAAFCASQNPASSRPAATPAAPSGGVGTMLAYHLLRKIPVGGEGGWDYLTCDAASRRVYVSRATRVIVLDADSGATVGEIPGTQGVHGIAIAPELHRGFTSNGRSNSVTIFDTRTLAIVSEVKTTGENPDAILYDPFSRRVFTFNGRGKNATAIDAATGAVAGTVDLEAKPEFAVSNGAGRVYANLEDTGEIAVLDARALRLETRWSLSPCQEPTGLAIDRKNRRLFAGCHNRLMAVLDAESGRAISTLPIGAGVDATAFDPAWSLAFASNGDGTLTVVREEAPDAFRVLDNVATQRGARTMALDEKTHRVFLATAEFGPAPPATAEQPRPRPPIVPDSFTILVVGP